MTIVVGGLLGKFLVTGGLGTSVAASGAVWFVDPMLVSLVPDDSHPFEIDPKAVTQVK